MERAVQTSYGRRYDSVRGGKLSNMRDYSAKHFNRKDGKSGRRGNSYSRSVTEQDVSVAQQVSAGIPISKARASIGKAGGSLTKTQKELVEIKQEEMRRRFLEDSEMIYENIKDLAFNARSELVRFNASKDILDRAGLAAPDKREVTENKFISTDSKITYDLLQRFKALELEGDSKNKEITTIDNEQ